MAPLSGDSSPRRSRRNSPRRSRRKQTVSLVDIPYLSFDGRFLEHVRIAKIYDGDSITVVVPFGTDGELVRLRARLYGVDACEMRGSERAHGIEAREELVKALRCPVDNACRYNETFFESNPVFIDIWCHGQDKFGRELIELAPCGCDPINEALCDTPHFSQYNGTGKRHEHKPL